MEPGGEKEERVGIRGKERVSCVCGGGGGVRAQTGLGVTNVTLGAEMSALARVIRGRELSY